MTDREPGNATGEESGSVSVAEAENFKVASIE
jgi:hypothetical protein